MSGHPDLNALLAIQDRDPAGGETQPTELDYARHKSWAIQWYGKRVWDEYVLTAWLAFGTDPV